MFKQRHPSFWAGSLGKGPHKSLLAQTACRSPWLPPVCPPGLGHTPPCSNERGLETTGVITAAGRPDPLRGAGSARR